MLNAIRAEIYKLKNSKVLRVLLIINVVVAVAATIIFRLPDFGGARLPGLYSSYYLPVLVLFIVPMLAVFCSISIGSEFLNSTFKNAVSFGIQRWQLYFTKWVSSLLVNIFLVILMIAVMTISNTILNGWQLASRPFEFYKGILIIIACILFVSGYLGVFIMVSFLVRHTGIATGINMVLFFADLIMVLSYKNIIRFSELLPFTYINALWPPSTFSETFFLNSFHDIMFKGALLTAAIITVTTVVGCFTIKRYEIK